MTAATRLFNPKAAPVVEATPPEHADLQKFMSAAAGGDIIGARSFLRKFGRQHVDTSRDGEGGYNALMWTAKSGNVQSIEFLADNGANVNAADRNLETPLIIAAWMDRRGAVLSLLFRGADTTAMDNEGLTPAMRARKHKHPEIADLIDRFARGENIDALRAERDALLVQAKAETAAKAEAAIDRRTVPEYDDYRSFLGGASDNDVSPLRKFLNQFGAGYIDSAREGNGGYTALMWASHRNALDAIRYLVSNGADTEVRDDKKLTPLMIASGFGRTEAVKLLLRLGADYKAVDADGLTSLQRAKKAGNTETAAAIEQFIHDKFTESLRGLREGVQKELTVHKASFKPKNRSLK